METRTKVIITGVLLFIIGLPVLFYINLAIGFGSSEGEYYRIANAKINFRSFAIDSNLTKQLKFIRGVDSSSEKALLINFELEYYSYKSAGNFGLYAARAPGQKGSKELIEQIDIYAINNKKNQTLDASSFFKLPDRLKLQGTKNNDNSYYEYGISDSVLNMVYVFEDLTDFKDRFNASKGSLFYWDIDQTPLVFFIKKEVLDTIEFNKLTRWYLQIKMSDGKIINCSDR